MVSLSPKALSPNILGELASEAQAEVRLGKRPNPLDSVFWPEGARAFKYRKAGKDPQVGQHCLTATKQIFQYDSRYDERYTA